MAPKQRGFGRRMNIYADAVSKWGRDSQLSQCAEECAELIVAISHYRRRRKGSLENLHEEVADVYIMVKQMMYMLGMSETSTEVMAKLASLERRIKE